MLNDIIVIVFRIVCCKCFLHVFTDLVTAILALVKLTHVSCTALYLLPKLKIGFRHFPLARVEIRAAEDAGYFCSEAGVPGPVYRLCSLHCFVGYH